MVNVITQIQIGCSRSKVAEYVSDPDHAPEWYANIKSVEWKTPKPLALGSQVTFVAHFLGRRLVYTYEFVELVPEEKLVMKTSEGPFPMETTYTWKSIDDNTTQMILRNVGAPTGFSKWFAPLMTIMIRKANKADLKRLKTILETSGS